MSQPAIKQSLIEKYFLLEVVLISFLALLVPSGFVWIKPHIPKILGIIMFGMGVSLTFNDFTKIWKHRILVLAGIGIQYSVMPLLAVVLSWGFNLPQEILIGMVLVGACPGGTASNVMTYLSKANLALSVTLTLLSTLLAPLLTPLIVFLFLSHKIDIAFWGMMKSVFWIVLFPLLDGLVLRHFLYRYLKKILPWFPFVSIIGISMIIGAVVALNQQLIFTFPVFIILAVFLHNSLGMGIGYGAARLLGSSSENAKTLAFEVGMQNSGLGVSLAAQFFSAATALPGAIFSVIHNITGVSMANFWGKKSA